jgi:predicted metal-dependent phosphoesterase TrpH
MKPVELITQAISVGLHGIAITDHDTMAGVFEAQKAAPPSFEIIPGEEITTDKGEVIGLFLTEEISPGPFDEVLFQIRSQGGLVILPHGFDPFRRAVMPSDQEATQFDAIEVLNGRARFPFINRNAQAYAQRNNCAMVCGSDAHRFFFFFSVTFAVVGNTDIRTAIKTGGVISGENIECILSPFAQ